MSHFTCIVIGNDPEAQLEPYDESIEVDEYQRELVSENDKELFMDTYCKYDPERDYATISKEDTELNQTLSFDDLYEKYGNDWNSNQWKKNTDGDWAEFSTYNPKSKWDWYQLGGRWRGFFKVKDGGQGNLGEQSWASREPEKGWADQLLKRDIDFDGMRNEAGDKARERYNEVLDIFGGFIPEVEHSWKTIIDPENPFFKEMTIDEKRHFFHNQPSMLEVKSVQEIEGNREKLGWSFDLENYQCTEEEFVQRARNTAISSFAVVKDGNWYERGEMGWWAIISNENENWDEEFAKLLDEVPDDTLISVFDCHI